MSLRTNYDGNVPGTLHDANYADIRFQMWHEFLKRRHVKIPDDDGGSNYPDLSNGEVVALAAAWKRAAAPSSQPSWPLWYDITVSALGWHAAGDRFDMTAKHMKAPAPPALIRLLWISTDELAVQLDGANTVLRPVIVDWSKEGYEAAAREAWHQMQREAHEDAKPLLPPMPTLPTPAPTPTPPSESGGLGWLLILLGIYLGTRKGR